jgi:hypothetical protein
VVEAMSEWRARVCAGAIAALVAVVGGQGTDPFPSHADIPPPVSLTSPPPHLGYGINVRDPGTVDPLFAPLGFGWLKLWEEYGTEQNPTLPHTRYPYKVLFLIDCTGRSDDLHVWGEAVETIATAGRGLVEAYEICNEPNRARWLNRDVSPFPPDPRLYVQMLQVAHQRIRAVDPTAIVVSAGLAPVGRIQGACNGWNGSNCDAMDEREYARHMLVLGAGETFDAFGYHPYGFAYEPERALSDLPPDDGGNGFAFRGVEVMHDLLEQHGLGHKSIWATEFSWLRDPDEDGVIPGWCHRIEEYERNFGWMDVPEVQQANYITRAFQYADQNWPWMGAMFVWNLDWHDYGWRCDPARYFSVLKVDYTDYSPYDLYPGYTKDMTPYQVWPSNASIAGSDVMRPYSHDTSTYVHASPAPYTTTLAYHALAAMDKRSGHFGPRLALVPPDLAFLADVDRPDTLTGVVVPLNVGYRVFTWTATVAVGMEVTPTLAITTGLQGTPLTVTLNSTGYTTGTFTGVITVTGTTTDVLDSPQALPVTLRVVPEVHRVYLPVALRSAH